MDFLLQNGTVLIAVWVIFAALTLYVVAVVWSHLSVNKLFWQNIFGSNRVALPKIAHDLSIPATDSGSAEGRALVLVQPEDEAEQDAPEVRGVIYPVAGRNGLHFWAQRCTSCQLCAYVCPVEAVTTRDTAAGYVRSFDLSVCVYCGLCEAACPTHAIRLTVNQAPTQTLLQTFRVEGEVEKEVCAGCGRKVPDAALLADRIYNLELNEDFSQNGFESAAVNLPNHPATLASGRELAQPEAPCPVCQQEVLELEEKICG